jgi:hypothetical protein
LFAADYQNCPKEVVVNSDHSRRNFLKLMSGAITTGWAGSAGLAGVAMPFAPRVASANAASPFLVAPPAQFPINSAQTDSINGLGFMHTDLQIFATGLMTATTHTWSTNEVQGFHGAVAVALLDQNRKLLWTSHTETFGVDGKLVPFGHNNRVDPWRDTVPANVLAAAQYLAIKQKWNPKPQTPENIARDLQALGNDASRELNSIMQAIDTVEKSLSNPTVSYTDSRGYSYVETSDSWKQLCTAFPCCNALQWPDYATYSFNTSINNKPAVVQLWKGNCEKFLGMSQFPGGIGAEVGVYRKIPGKVRPQALSFLPPQVASAILGPIRNLNDSQLWWAYPELNAQIQFSLVNPITGQIFFSTGTETTYWLNRWMNPDSYGKYKRDEGNGKTPPPFQEVKYVLHYSINGKNYTW